MVSIFLRLIIFVEYKMAKKLKRKKSKILQNMNPDFVNKLVNIMGGRSASLDKKNSSGSSTAKGTAVTTKKNPPKKKSYSSPPPLLPLPTIKKQTEEPKPEPEPEPKPEPLEVPEKDNKSMKSQDVKIQNVTHGNNRTGEENTWKKTTSIQNTDLVNESYFKTVKELLSMTYKNNGEQVRYIVELNELLETKKQEDLRNMIPRQAIDFLLWGVLTGLLTGSIVTSLWFI